MYTVTHTPISAKTGEPVKITFTVTDLAGAPVSLDGAEASYKIARRAGGAALLEKTGLDGITLSANTAAVEFNTGELSDGDGPLLGDFLGQLTLTVDGDGLVVAEGTVSVGAVIS